MFRRSCISRRIVRRSIFEAAAPVCVVSTSDVGFDAGVVPVVEVDVVDVSGFSGARVSDVDRLSPLRASNTAYVIFTSGSTGRPKGVAVSHAADGESAEFEARVSVLTSMMRFAQDGDDVRFVVWEFWSALVSGSSVGDREGRRSAGSAVSGSM